MNQKQIGIIAVLIAALMWAFEPLFARLSYSNASFIQTSIIRAYVVVLVTALYILLKDKRLFRIEKKKLSALFYIAIVGTLFADLIYFYAFLKTSVLNAVLLGHLQPLFIVILAFFILKQDALHFKNYLGIILMMSSALLVSTKTIENALSLSFGSIGDLLVLCSTIAWATTALAMRKYLTTMAAGVITFYRFFIASIFFTFTIPFIQISSVDIYQIAVGIIVSIGTICYYEGLKRLKAAQVSGIEQAAPVFAAIIGFFIFQEIVTWMQIVGIMFLFIGVFLLSSHKELFNNKKSKKQNN